MNRLTFAYPGNGLLVATFENFNGPTDREFLERLGDPKDSLHEGFKKQLAKKVPGIELEFSSLLECKIHVPEGAEYGRVAHLFFRELCLYVDSLGEAHEFWAANYVRGVEVDFGDEFQRTMFYMGTWNPKQLKSLLAQAAECLP